ncbi:DUF4412 domain-containing protein [Aestuariivivens sediminis]|uniref:DUF4412 domain-containing protein n=1 Tax=Aestuariivivens sediminis TaxID=2913557 RepID=UPI001F5605FB|nr:DUF4412 domain-containing protein [Aestuariivivens sediminis]
MRTKYIFLSIFLLALCQTTEAQFLKKLKKKAEQAAERTVLKKTDELVTHKTEKTIDDVVVGHTDDDQEENTSTTPDATSDTNLSQTPGMNPLMGSGKNAAKNILDTYAFDWEFKTNMIITGKKKSKNTETLMNFFLNTNKDYYGMDVENEEMLKSGGQAVMIFDFKSENMVMFANQGGRKMGMVNKLKDPAKTKVSDKDRNYTYKEIGTKTILGYECYGMEVENEENKVQLFFTLDAPVNFSAFFAFSSDAAPKGFSDPQLFDILKEEALLMEMEMISKKKNESMKMVPISLEPKKTVFHKKDYQFMSMGI